MSEMSISITDKYNNIIKNQPVFNIGCLGCVSDGKSTLVEKLTNIKTQKHSSEKERNITIKQGYANMKIYDNDTNLINHVSFVDCPGHQDYILTLLQSASIMDGVIVVIAVNQLLSRKELLLQHLKVIEILKINKVIICLNKIDLVPKENVKIYKDNLDKLLDKFSIKPYKIIPTSLSRSINLDKLMESIREIFKFSYDEIIDRSNKDPIFIINRSFDINKPGTEISKVKPGIIGGTLIQGKLKIGDRIEINRDKMSIETEIKNIKTENSFIQDSDLYPGGLVGLETNLDPTLCKNDGLNGNIFTLTNKFIKNKKLYITLEYIDDKWTPCLGDLVVIIVKNKYIKVNVINVHDNLILVEPVDNIYIVIVDKSIIIICKINNINANHFRIIGSGYNCID